MTKDTDTTWVCYAQILGHGQNATYRNQAVLISLPGDPEKGGGRSISSWVRTQSYVGQRTRWGRGPTVLAEQTDERARGHFSRSIKTSLVQGTYFDMFNNVDRRQVSRVGHPQVMIFTCKFPTADALKLVSDGKTPYKLLDKFKRVAHKRFGQDIS